MPDGGVIRLVARRLNPLGRDAMDWPGLSDGEPSAKKFLAFDVIDQGKGISDSEKPLVFEPFYSTKPPATGTGLGLSSVHGFVMQSEGDVKIFDNPGGGTRVSMIFPMAVQHVRQPKMQLLRDRLEPCRILVVEDNEAVGQSLQTSLASRGFLVTLVSSGEAAIARLSEKSRDIDLVLSDVRMPGAVDGFALQRWTNEHLPALRFILMSGYSCGDSDVTSTFLQKPFTDEQLIECIRQELQSTEPQHRMRA